MFIVFHAVHLSFYFYFTFCADPPIFPVKVNLSRLISTIASGEYRRTYVHIIHVVTGHLGKLYRSPAFRWGGGGRTTGEKKRLNTARACKTGREKSVTDARWSVERNAAWQGHWWWWCNKKREIVSFLRYFFRRHSSARRTAGVGVENALRSIRSRHWPIPTVLLSHYVYFRYISRNKLSVRCLLYFIDSKPSVNAICEDKRQTVK